MGGPSPDTVGSPVSPWVALTLADMVSQGWSIRGYCGRCNLSLAIGLEALCRAQGPLLLLWGRTFPCPILKEGRYRCEGRMHYMAQTIAGGSWRRLDEVSDQTIASIRDGKDPYKRRYVRSRDAPADS